MPPAQSRLPSAEPLPGLSSSSGFKATAYFDVDGTLVGTNLLQPTAYFLGNQGTPLQSLGSIGRALLNAPLLALAELQDRRRFNELLFSHFKGMSEDRVMVLADEVFDNVVKPRIFPGARELIDQCHRAKLRVVLVTGSLDVTMRPLARHLGADHVIANRLEFKDLYATGRLLRPVVAGPEKSGLLVKDAADQGHDLRDCHAYSDSYSDVPMLSVVGHPACINPDDKLVKLAHAYNWPILDIQSPSRESKREGAASPAST